MKSNVEKEYEAYFAFVEMVKKGIEEGEVKSFKFDNSQGLVEVEFFEDKSKRFKRLRIPHHLDGTSAAQP